MRDKWVAGQSYVTDSLSKNFVINNLILSCKSLLEYLQRYDGFIRPHSSSKLALSCCELLEQSFPANSRVPTNSAEGFCVRATRMTLSQLTLQVPARGSFSLSKLLEYVVIIMSEAAIRQIIKVIDVAINWQM